MKAMRQLSIKIGELGSAHSAATTQIVLCDIQTIMSTAPATETLTPTETATAIWALRQIIKSTARFQISMEPEGLGAISAIVSACKLHDASSHDAECKKELNELAGSLLDGGVHNAYKPVITSILTADSISKAIFGSKQASKDWPNRLRRVRHVLPGFTAANEDPEQVMAISARLHQNLMHTGDGSEKNDSMAADLTAVRATIAENIATNPVDGSFFLGLCARAIVSTFSAGSPALAIRHLELWRSLPRFHEQAFCAGWNAAAYRYVDSLKALATDHKDESVRWAESQFYREYPHLLQRLIALVGTRNAHYWKPGVEYFSRVVSEDVLVDAVKGKASLALTAMQVRPEIVGALVAATNKRIATQLLDRVSEGHAV